MWAVLKSVFGQGWVGSLIGIIGLLVGYLFYRASGIGPRPVYQLRALRLIGKEEDTLPEEVEILFRGKTVPRLTKTHVILWNSGKGTLHGRDIVQTDPLRLEFSKGTQVLKPRLLKVTRAANKFKVMINPNSPNELLCSFDYLDREDGATIELLHTDKERYPKVQGAVRGIPKGALNWGRVPPSPTPFFLFVVILIAGAVVVVAGALVLRAIFRMSGAPLPRQLLTIVLTAGFAYATGIIFQSWPTRRRFPKSLTIEDIEG